MNYDFVAIKVKNIILPLVSCKGTAALGPAPKNCNFFSSELAE